MKTANTLAIISLCGRQNSQPETLLLGSLWINRRGKKEDSSNHTYITWKKTNWEQTWIHTNECTVMGECFSAFSCHTNTHKALSYPPSIQFVFHYVAVEVFTYSKVVLVAIQLVYQLLKQWTVRCPCGSFCVSSFITIHLRLNYTLYFHFLYEVWPSNVSAQIRAQSLITLNISFLAICREITCSTILEKENECV